MTMTFDACEYCDGPVRGRRVTVDFRRKAKLWVFQNVPVGVCSKCGERYYAGPVLERLDDIVRRGVRTTKKIAVPTVDFAKVG